MFENETVVNDDNAIIHIYLESISVPFSVDRKDEKFNKKTNIGKYHKAVYINHNGEHPLGSVVDINIEEDGYRFLHSVVLLPKYQWIIDEVIKEQVFTSTGIGLNEKKMSVDGTIIEWPIVEASLIFPYTDKEEFASSPANWSTLVRIATRWKGQKLLSI